MSKVYEAHLQMEELAQDIGWQEWQEEQERLKREDLDLMQQFEDFISGENMVECKAQQFAKKIVEL